MSASVRRPAGFSGLIRAGVGLIGLFCLAMASPALAGMGSDSAIEQYAFNLDDRAAVAPATVAVPLPLSIGVAGRIQKRELAFEGYDTSAVEMRHLGAYIGLDLTPWCTVRALLGESDFKPDAEATDRFDADTEWGVGVAARLLNWSVDPVLCNISWIRFDASAQYLDAGAKDGANKVEWQECYSDLTVSLVTVPPEGDTARNISVFAGPAFSWIDGKVKPANGISSDFNEDQLVGITTGLVVVPHDNIALRLELQIFNDISYGASVGFHF